MGVVNDPDWSRILPVQDLVLPRMCAIEMFVIMLVDGTVFCFIPFFLYNLWLFDATEILIMTD